MTPESIQQIVASMTAGNPLEAERLCRAHLREQPHDENGLVLLALSLQHQGRLAEAANAYYRLTELFPDSSLHLCNYATALRQTGLLSEAEATYKTALKLDSRNINPKIQLGLMLLDRHDYLAARELLLDAFELDRSLPMARIHAARACSLCQDFQGAEDLLKPWRNWLPINDEVLQLELARQLNLLSDAPSAAVLLEDLVGRNPSHIEAKVLLANMYERLNRVAESESMLRSVANSDELASSEAHRNEVDHLKATLALRSGDVVAARSLLEHGGPRHANDYTHHFDLARAYDKLGETELAMHSLRSAHAIQAKELAHASPEHFEAGALALPAAIPRVSAESHARWARVIAPDARNSPVFIVGFPRSGTTLLEQMLDAHPGLQSMDENPFFNRLADKLRNHHPDILSNLDLLQQRDCDELRKSYLLMVSETIQRRWSAQLVDKNPLNMMWVPLIHRLFPEAKFILALRHPCDVILSCYMQNFRSSILGAACASLDRLAAAYVQAMECWLGDERIFQPQVLVSRYEELVTDFPGQTRRIADFLELEDATPMLQFDRHARDKGYIATPSYTQVIEPVNRKGLHRWVRYRREFEPLLPVLEPMLRRWGYSADVPT
ncbi:tetratricopeptide repeat-containing sulfotransferase family protein [Rhodanobacter sp. C01]|uniref:tetratricopeptide repeat-containing sulfotransferase family protein n=1 Tax=Rhodanobacter sp. C01 TaxID=1945856 RepID=UPI0009849058|nr:tetratricopeptide repeat-containing sulfotransferase family protein [Rhodanobacter sp. C01]OOG51324.1 sulfotransferase [Rhodanobacter sp. C01]